MPQPLQRSTSEYNLLPFDGYEVDGDERSVSGPCRLNNEDRSALLIPRELERLQSHGLLALVADGMGGHEGGEVASDLAASLIPQHYYQLAEATQDALPRIWLQEAFHLANRRIHETAQEQPELAGMGTTCTGLVIRAGLAWCAHVGDSRAYLVREGQIYRMTQDHSATMEMVNRGLLSLADARHHEDRNVILRAMGTYPDVLVSTWKDPFPIRPGDCFVLCSDGLHDALNDDEIGEQCVAQQSATQICDALINLADTRQASDNVTAVVLCVRKAGSKASASEGGGSQP
ncbi:MAG: protein phosphatase 2C domain-containing protein [Bryobacterales bacterium]|jgi:protein phosphatase|nr:protein phosphatase 2C domain-containing protein [Bryobacterales bacterium]